MKIKVFYPNKNGKVEFTKIELEQLLNEVYQEGRTDAKAEAEAKTITSPWTVPYSPIITPTYDNPPPQIWCATTGNAYTIKMEDYNATGIDE